MLNSLGFLGGGHMTTSIIKGLTNVKDKPDALQMNDIWIFDRNPEKMDYLTSSYGVQAAQSSQDLIRQVDSLVISIKPQVLQESIKPLSAQIRDKVKLVISLAAGVRTTSIESWLDGNIAVCRAMPNLGSSIGLGATGLYANQIVNSSQKKFTENLMNATGLCAWVENEVDIDAVTGLSGSGPAYFLLFIQHLIESATATGLSKDIAQQLALQTARAATELVQQSDQDISNIVESICLAGGTTEQAVASLKENDLKSVVNAAYMAARNRAEELAQQLNT